MSELSVGSLSGLAANSYVIDVASGSTLDLSNATDLPASALPTGSILQVVSTTKTDTFSSTSTSFTDVTGLSASITPSSATSKILVSVMICFGHSSLGQFFPITLADGSNNNLIAASSPGSRLPSFRYGATSHEGMDNAGLVLLHSPATTSSFTYKVRISHGDAGTVYVNRGTSDADSSNRGRGVSTITLMEVAG